MILLRPHQLVLELRSKSKTIDDLMDLLMNAGPGSALENALVDGCNTAKYPRPAIERTGPRAYQLRFMVPETRNTDELSAELWAVFEKNGWHP